MGLPVAHAHVTEREVWHRWPDGQIDDAKWEDCAFCSALEMARVCKNPAIPATHTEAEALRDDAGLTPAGGATQPEVMAGLKTRYSFVPRLVFGATYIWNAMVPGVAASVQGSYGVWPDGSHWRRWDPVFKGIHQATAMRLDSTDRVWWCDPLAPQDGTYNGEWMPKADFLKYINGYAQGGALVAMILPDALPSTATEEPVSQTIIKEFPFGGKFTIKQGQSVTGYMWDPEKGVEVLPRKIWPAGAASGADIDATWAILRSDPGMHGGFIHVSTGYFAGYCIPQTEVEWHANPAPAPDCSSAVATATKPLQDEIAALNLKINRAKADLA